VTHSDLVTAALSAHGAVFLAAAAAFYKYGDRTDLQQKTLAACDSALSRIRSRVASSLADHLRPLLADSAAVPSIIVSPDNVPAYTERLGNPLASERYFEYIRKFTDQDVDAVADYRELREARSAWCKCARFLSWALLLLLLWQAVATGFILADKIDLLVLGGRTVYLAFAPTALILVGVFLSAAALQRNHDRIMDNTANHGL